MQKPQQRKYHSSCNRSVHRGTAHGKQEVKVCKRKTPHLFLMRSFLSPYGDGTADLSEVTGATMFSPPYGDGTICLLLEQQKGWFSPPYGDCTVPTSARARCSPSSPPYGDGTVFQNIQALSGSVFAPLRGWYLTGQQIPRLFHVFAPLRGSWRAAPERVLQG